MSLSLHLGMFIVRFRAFADRETNVINVVQSALHENGILKVFS